MLPETFASFLIYIGSNVFVGILVSKLLEHQKFFKDLTAQGKTNFVMVLHLVLGLVSYFLVSNVSPEFVAKVQPIYAIIASIISQYLSSTEYHDAVIDKRNKPTTTTDMELSLKSKTEAPTTGNTATSGRSLGKGG